MRGQIRTAWENSSGPGLLPESPSRPCPTSFREVERIHQGRQRASHLPPARLSSPLPGALVCGQHGASSDRLLPHTVTSL